MLSKAAGLWVMLIFGCGSRPPQEPQPAASNPQEPEAEPASERSEAAGPCRGELIGPALVSEADYAGRTGLGARRFSELRTSMQAPLEECGLRAVLQRLATLTCDDGQNPFQGDLRAAHESRKGNYGPGGRCEKIIDMYEVRCSNATFEVYADMYICTEATAGNWLQ